MDESILHPGELIDGKYEIISMLGQGAMGVVYRARAVALNRDVAIKLLTHGDRETVSRFSAEAQSLARVKHPTVVRVDNFGASEKWGPYLVLSYIPGRDLDAVAAAGLRIEDAVSLVIELCTGVFACHVRSVIHGNLKPSNVLVTNETIWLRRVKILDLGMAVPIELGVADHASRYLAPELIRRERATARCDQYGVAALLYLLVTGRAPFGERAGDDLVRAILLGSVLPARQLRAEVPADLEAIIAKACHRDPAQRFQTVKALALALVPFAPESFKNKTTRYFMDMEGAIDLRLIEPVSAHRPAGGPAVLPSAPAPLVREAPRWTPVPGAAEPAPVRRFRKTAPAAQVTENACSRQPTRPSPWAQSNAVVLFVLGTAMGAAIATAVFVAVILYRERRAEPSFAAPPAGATSGSHAAH